MITRNQILFVMSADSVSYPILKSNGYNIVEPYRRRSRCAYKIRYLLHLLRIDNLIGVLSEPSEDFLNSNPKLIIIEGSLIYIPFIRHLRKRFPIVRTKFCYSNIVKVAASISPKILTKFNIEGWSWDPKDCKTYHLHYLKPFFDEDILPNSETLVYDACFIGKDKGRYHTVRSIQRSLESLGYKCFIKVIPPFNFLKKLHNYYSEPISYVEYLSIVSKSRCVIDIVQQGQTGTTMRVFESLFGQKKLITNNHDIITYDFYDKRNIFILGKDSIADLKLFMESDYVQISQDILEEYKPTQWINRIIND